MQNVPPILIALLLVLQGIGQAQPPAIKEPPTLKDLATKIDDAIHKGVDAILRDQAPDGTWPVNEYGYPVGPTALFTYTLIKCGLGTDHPAVARGLKFLERNLSQKTYGAACQLMAFEAAKDKKYKPQMKELLARIIEWQKGGWGYPHSEVDLSNTQYAALGLRAARMAGLKIPRGVVLKLIDQTFQHQQKPKKVDLPPDRNVEEGYERASGQAMSAGFSYRINKTNRNVQPATGSMTTAGLGILLICRDLLQDKLPRSLRRGVDRSMSHGENWMRLNFKVNTNPPRNGNPYYYLYGLERVGDIARREIFAGRYWYREGAAFIVKAQRNGKWGGLPDTAFALLFLKRATWVGSVTGAGGTDRNQRTYLASADNAEIKLRGAGNPTMSLWIAGLNQKKLDKRFPKTKGKQEIVVSSVEYLIDGKVIHRAAGDKEPWQGQPYAHRHEFKKRGRYSVAARIHAGNPDAGKDGEADTIILESPLLVVDVLDLPDLEADKLNQAIDKNKLRGIKARITHSSILNRWGKMTPWFADGRLSTAWMSNGRSVNEIPWIKIKPERALRCTEILLWPNQTLGQVKQIQVFFNGSIRPKTIDVEDPRKPIRIPFRRRRVIETLEIKITDKLPAGNSHSVGFAEIVIR